MEQSKHIKAKGQDLHIWQIREKTQTSYKRLEGFSNLQASKKQFGQKEIMQVGVSPQYQQLSVEKYWQFRKCSE